MPNLSEYVPDHLRDYQEIMALMDAAQPEMDAAAERLEQIWNDQYFASMSEETYLRWRRVLRLNFSSDPAWQAETDPAERERLLGLRREFVRTLASIRTPVKFTQLQALIEAGCDVTRGGAQTAGAKAQISTAGVTLQNVKLITVVDVRRYDVDGNLVTDSSALVERCVLRLIRAMIPADRLLRHNSDIYEQDPDNPTHYNYSHTTQKEEVLL